MDRAYGWGGICLAIGLGSAFTLVINIRRQIEAGQAINYKLCTINTLISLMLGLIFAVAGLAYVNHVNHAGNPGYDYIVLVMGLTGSLISYRGFNFLSDRMGLIFDRIVNKVIGDHPHHPHPDNPDNRRGNEHGNKDTRRPTRRAEYDNSRKRRRPER